MSSSERSDLSGDHDPMDLVSKDEIGPVEEVFTSDTDSDPDFMSDDDDLADFQPFALADLAGDDILLVDDALALPLPIHDQFVIGHPDGKHIVEAIPIPAIPLTSIPLEDWPFVVDLDDNEIPIFHVDHPDEDLGDGGSLTLPFLRSRL
ncbi:hypothetical protein Hanom_Chr07g00623241 [Helianthus anomalus]